MSFILPPELVQAILVFATSREDGLIQPDYKTLCHASLVHPTWTEPAQSLLYRQVTYAKSTKFVQLLLSPASQDSLREIGSKVRKWLKASCVGLAAYWMPRSEWWISPGADRWR